MLNYYTDSCIMPDLPIYTNCDTIIAVNIRRFNLSDHDEFIFTIRNYDHRDAPAIFLFKATNNDMDSNGEIIFKVPSTVTKYLKYGAFYTIAAMVGATDTKNETIYRQLADNGNILVKHGASDMIVKTELSELEYEIIDTRLELLETTVPDLSTAISGVIVDMRLEQVDD